LDFPIIFFCTFVLNIKQLMFSLIHFIYIYINNIIDPLYLYNSIIINLNPIV
jgi:hypothetical protein